MSLPPLPKCIHCVWCGHMPRVDWFKYPGRPDEHFVRCGNGLCAAQGPVRSNDEDAVGDWNKVMSAARPASHAKVRI